MNDNTPSERPVQRYSMESRGLQTMRSHQDSDGPWCAYADHARALAAVEAERDEAVREAARLREALEEVIACTRDAYGATTHNAVVAFKMKMVAKAALRGDG